MPSYSREVKLDTSRVVRLPKVDKSEKWQHEPFRREVLKVKRRVHIRQKNNSWNLLPQDWLYFLSNPFSITSNL